MMLEVFLVETNSSDKPDCRVYLQCEGLEIQIRGVPEFFSHMFFTDSSKDMVVGGLQVDEWVQALEQGDMVRIRGEEMQVSIEDKLYRVLRVAED